MTTTITLNATLVPGYRNPADESNPLADVIFGDKPKPLKVKDTVFVRMSRKAARNAVAEELVLTKDGIPAELVNKEALAEAICRMHPWNRSELISRAQEAVRQGISHAEKFLANIQELENTGYPHLTHSTTD